MQTPDTTQTPSTPPAAPHRAAARQFFILAMVSLCVSGVWLAVTPEVLLATEATPSIWSLLFVLIAGCFFSLAFAALHAAAPSLYQARILPQWMAQAHFVVHLACVLLVPILMVIADGEWLQKTWMIFFALPLLFVLPIFFIMQNGRNQSAATAFLNAAAFWLLVVIGVAVCRVAGWIPEQFAPARWVPAGFVLLFAGVFANLIHGVLLSYAAGCNAGSPVVTLRVGTALVLVNLGVAFLFHAVAVAPRGVIALFAAIYCLGVAWLDVVVWGLLRARGTAAANPGVRMWLLASWMVFPAAAVGVATLWREELGAALLPNSFVVTVAFGVAALFALGAFDLLLFTVFAAKTTAEPTLSRQIQIAGYVNAAIGVFVMVPGIWIGNEKVSSLGVFFFLMSLVALVARVVMQFRRQATLAAAAASQG